MMVLLICRPVPDTDRAAFVATLADEAAALRELKASGELAQAWSPGGPGAVLLLDVPDATRAANIAAALPLAAAKLIATEIIALSPLEL